MKRHPYIFATLIATLLTLVVWLCTPKTYTAIIKVSDEYKEVDLAIGLTQIQASIRNMSNDANKGLNDMAVYCKVLVTEDFARSISHKRVPNKDMTYGEYLGKKDTIETIQSNINYNYNNNHETLTISFTDKDALVAAQILDSITVQLQAIVTARRHTLADARLKNAKKEQDVAKRKYDEAQKAYAAFVDSHTETTLKTESQQEQVLENEVKLAYNDYKKATESRARQQALKERSYLSFTVIRSNTVPQKHDQYFFGTWSVFIFIALLLTFWTIRLKARHIKWNLGNSFSPWAITLAIWSVIIILIQLSDSLEPISNQFWVSFCIWIPLFCISSFVTFNLTKGDKVAGFDSMDMNISWYYFLFVLAMILTPMYLYKTYTIISMFDTKDLMLSIRQWTLYGDNYGFLNYSQPILQATLLISLWKFRTNGIKWWYVLILATVYLLFCLGKMEKLGMFVCFIYIIYTLFEKKIIRIRTIVILGVVLLLTFYFFNLFRQGEDSDYAKNETLLDFIGMYIMSGTVAYGRLRQNISDYFGIETLNTFYTYFYKWILGETFEAGGTQFKEFVFIPIPTNVYTIFSPFFSDFGQRGIAFFSLIMGTLSGWLYALSRGNSLFFKCLYTMMVSVLAMQFFDEIFIVSLMSYIHTTILLVLMTQKRFYISLSQTTKWLRS